MASPRLDRFERAAGVVQGMEAFWIDVGEMPIPSNYYYLAAQNEALSTLMRSKQCELPRAPGPAGPASRPDRCAILSRGLRGEVHRNVHPRTASRPDGSTSWPPRGSDRSGRWDCPPQGSTWSWPSSPAHADRLLGR